MPITPTPFTPRVFVGDRFDGDRGRLIDLARARGAMEAEALRQQGNLSGVLWAQLGNNVAGTLGDIAHGRQVAQQQAQANALAHAKFAQEQQDKERDFALRAAQFEELSTQRKAAEEAKEALAADKNAQRVGQMTPGAIPQEALEMAQADPLVASRTRYNFGPGTTEGPELLPTPEQQRLAAAEDFAKKQGGVIGPNGQIMMPPKAPVVNPPNIGSFEDYVVRKYGPQPTPAQIESARATYVVADNKVATAPPTPPGDWNLTGEDFLKTVPPQSRMLVKKIAQYDLDPSQTSSMRGDNRERMLAWVSQVNPAYDQSQFKLRAPTRKAFTTGVQGQQINAINTAMGHLDQLTDVADQLQTGGFVPGNKAFNALRTMLGSDKVTNFDTLKDALAGEVAGVLSKGGATVSGIQDAKSHITAANSPKQLAGYVKTLIPVLGSKLAAFDYQYKQAMGENDAFSPLSAESKRILIKHGFDPEHPTIGGGSAQTYLSTDPNYGQPVKPKGR